MKAIEVKNLSLKLGNTLVLDSISFTLEAGEFLSILGPNGGGKSSLLKVILGLIKADSGSVNILEKEPFNKQAQEIGYVPQLKTLDRRFPAQAIELVANGLRGSWIWRLSSEEKEKSMLALKRVGAESLAKKNLSELSGGELQRVYLARCLVRHAKIIILDEPATGIDIMGESDLYHILEDYRKETGASILMVTHDWEVAWHHSSQALLLNKRMLAFGTPAEALTEEALKQAYGHSSCAHHLKKAIGHA